MEREPSRRRFITGCCVAGAGALAAGGLAGGATAETDDRQSTPETRWERTYDRGTSVDVNGVAPASDGEFVLVGTTESSGDETVSEAWLARVDAAGQLVWEATFSDREVTEGFGVAAAPDGFVLVGHTREEGATAQSAFAVRVDTEGTEQWRRTFDARPSTTDTMRAVDVDSDGRFVFVGWTSRFDDAWVTQLDDSGSINWAKRYGPGSRNQYHGVVADPEGGYVVVGETDDTSGDTAGWANKLDEEGGQVFSQQFKKSSDSATNPQDDFNAFYDVDRTRKGFVAVGANAFDPKTNEQRGWALEFNVNGGKLWDKRYTEENYTELRSVSYGDLEYYVAGQTATDGNGTNARGYAANLGIEGDMKWKGTWGSGSSEFSAFDLTEAEGMVCVGSTADFAGANTSGWGVKVGGEEVATRTPSPTPSPTPTPSPSDGSTPTFTPTPTDTSSGTDGGGETDATDTAAPTPAGTETPGDGGTGGGTETTDAADGDGGISPTTIGIGAVILALGGGGLLYNRFLAGDDDADVAGPGEGTGGAAPVDTGDGDGGDGDSGGVETTEPDTEGTEEVQSAQTVVEGEDASGGADAGESTEAADADADDTDTDADGGDTDTDADGGDTDTDTDGGDTDTDGSDTDADTDAGDTDSDETSGE
ncbi:hypothetical protein [Halosimplex salinum]|uniref:hypothetical protein n=1 Tax=Halosimplex salinum TaxID=1710538 RepID=UPI000F46C6E0|nr:hypothetical protein [Halosimplex salinum]